MLRRNSEFPDRCFIVFWVGNFRYLRQMAVRLGKFWGLFLVYGSGCRRRMISGKRNAPFATTLEADSKFRKFRLVDASMSAQEARPTKQEP